MTYRSPLEIAIWRSLARALRWGAICAAAMYSLTVLLALLFVGSSSSPKFIDGMLDPRRLLDRSLWNALGFLDGPTLTLLLWFLVGTAVGFVYSMHSWRRTRRGEPSGPHRTGSKFQT